MKHRNIIGRVIANPEDLEEELGLFSKNYNNCSALLRGPKEFTYNLGNAPSVAANKVLRHLNE